jgi:hypothetical protein
MLFRSLLLKKATVRYYNDERSFVARQAEQVIPRFVSSLAVGGVFYFVVTRSRHIKPFVIGMCVCACRHQEERECRSIWTTNELAQLKERKLQLDLKKFQIRSGTEAALENVRKSMESRKQARDARDTERYRRECMKEAREERQELREQARDSREVAKCKRDEEREHGREQREVAQCKREEEREKREEACTNRETTRDEAMEKRAEASRKKV